MNDDSSSIVTVLPCVALNFISSGGITPREKDSVLIIKYLPMITPL
jgi:hypothetical protein